MPDAGRSVAIVGEAGVGKSRLVWEFTHSHRTHGWLVLEERLGLLWEGHAVPAGHRAAEGYFKIEERDDQREIRERVAGKLLTLDRTLEPLFPPLLALLDVPVDDPRGRRSTLRNAGSGPWRRSSGCCSGKARSNRSSGSSRICTGSIPRPRRCSTA